MDALSITLISVASLAALGFASGALLAAAARIFAVEVDPRTEEINKVLPGANCGACGYAGCKAYAEAVLKGADPTLCRLGGSEVAKKIAEIAGVKSYEVAPKKAVILCGAARELCEERSDYLGEKTCRANTLVAGGLSACIFGCLAYGDCVEVCPVGAIRQKGKLPPMIDREKCVGCGKCAAACPRNVIIIEDEEHKTFVLCRSFDKGAFVKKICKMGCIACRICVKECPEGTMTMEGRLPVVNYLKGEPTTECIAKCPQKTIIKYK
jgi:RnfABCDGE-type electron transport complex B subunit